MAKKRNNQTKFKSQSEKTALTGLTQRSLSDYVAMARNTSYWRSYGGDGTVPETVTIASAMRSAAVWACVNAITNQICSLPVNLVKDDKGKFDAKIPVFEKPSPRMSKRGWIGQFVRSFLTAGNTYADIVQVDKMGMPIVVEIMDPDLVTWTIMEEPMVLGMKRELWPSGDFWHVPVSHLMVPGSVVALGPIQHASRSITSGMKAEKFGNDFYDSGGLPINVLKSSVKGLTDTAADTAKQKLDLAQRNRKTAVLGAEWDLVPMTVDIQGGQMIEAQRFAVEQACRWFGVPPSMVYASVSGASLTYANITQSDLYFLKYSINGWIQDIEDAWSEFLPEHIRVKFNTDAILRLDKKARTEEHGLRLAQKTRTINEVRLLEDEEPFDDPKYDEPGIPADPAPEPVAPAAPSAPTPPGAPGAGIDGNNGQAKKPPGQSVVGKRAGGGGLSEQERDPFIRTNSESSRFNDKHEKDSGRFGFKGSLSPAACFSGPESLTEASWDEQVKDLESRTGISFEELDAKGKANLTKFALNSDPNDATWYPDSSKVMDELTDKFEARRKENNPDGEPITKARVCAALARTSPRTDFVHNVETTDVMLQRVTSKELTFTQEDIDIYLAKGNGKKYPLPEGFKPGTYPTASLPTGAIVASMPHATSLPNDMSMAIEHLRGQRTTEETLPPSTPKIRNFYMNHLDPTNPRYVTADTFHYMAFMDGVPISRPGTTGPRKTLQEWRAEGLDAQKIMQYNTVTMSDGVKARVGAYPIISHSTHQWAKEAGISVNGGQAKAWNGIREETEFRKLTNPDRAVGGKKTGPIDPVEARKRAQKIHTTIAQARARTSL